MGLGGGLGEEDELGLGKGDGFRKGGEGMAREEREGKGREGKGRLN